MKRLYDLSTAPFKDLKLFPKGTHNDTVASRGYFDAIADFLEQQCMGREKKL